MTVSNPAIASIFDRAAERYDASSNPYTMRRRAEALAALVTGRSIEVGGGTGLVNTFLDDRSQAFHSDIALGMCRVACQKLGCPSVCFDGEVIPFADSCFDTVIACEMIYYLGRPERFFDEAFRILKPGGRLLISTTNPAATILDRGRSLFRRLGFKQMFFDDGSPRFFSRGFIRRLLEESGFELERVYGIAPLPFECLDGLNRVLERTPLHLGGLFLIIVGRKLSA